MSYAFISYFREDKGTVEKFLKAFDRAGVPYWIDRRGLEIGHEWRQMIRSKIFDAGAFVLFLSKQYSRKPHSFVHEELKIACERLAELGRTVTWVYPVSLDGEAIPQLRVDATRTLADYQGISAKHGLDRTAKDLSERVKSFLRDPTLNKARLGIRCMKLRHAPNLYVDGKDTGIQLPEDGRIEIEVAPGNRNIHLVAFFEVMNQAGRTHRMAYSSNALSLGLQARQSVPLLARPSKRKGFLWIDSENGVDIVLEHMK